MTRKSLVRPFARLGALWLMLALLAPLAGYVAPARAAAAQIYVATTGSDAANITCQTPQAPCKTIGHALSLVSGGGTISIAAGNYIENLTITIGVTLAGAGANTTSIDGGGAGAVFTIPTAGNATIIGLTIRNGNNSANGGGAIQNRGSLTLKNSVVSGNSTSGGKSGGGLYNNGAAATMSLIGNTITGNTSNSDGGAIYNFQGTLTIANTTIFGNQANSAQGGALYNQGGTVNINNTTVFSNTATGSGGGLYNNSGTINVRNSILAANRGGGSAYDCYGTITSLGYNLIQAAPANCNISGTSTGNLLNKNPGLGPLRDNGGATETLAPLPGSPAIDAGSPAAPGSPAADACAAADQRTALRPLPSGGRCDIGAYELGIVTWYANPTGNNTNDCQSPATPCKTLAEAALRATNGETLMLAGGTYAENLKISESLTLIGAGSAQTSVSGPQAGPVLTIDPGKIVSISGVAITNNKLASGGGGVLNNGILTLTNSKISNNLNIGAGGGIVNTGTLAIGGGEISNNTTALPGGGILNSGTLRLNGVAVSGNSGASGGGIENSGVLLAISNSTISGNSGATGGGIENSAGKLNILSSTISGNTTSGGKGGGVATLAGATTNIISSTISLHTGSANGGGIWNAGTLSLINSTLNGNTSTAAGGAIANDGAQLLSLANVTLSANSAPSGGAIANLNNATLEANNATISGNSSGIANSGGAVSLRNTVLAGNTGGDCSGTINSQDFNLIGSAAGCTIQGAVANNRSGAPKLRALADNGGPTQTMAPQDRTSPAIDGGDNATCTANDQRGAARPVGPRCDIGAFEIGQTTWYVDAAAGSDSNSCKSGLKPCKTIAATIGQAVDGDIIVIGPGAYPENLMVDNNRLLTLSGADANTTAIGGNQPGRALLTIAAGSEADISGLTLGGGSAGGIDNSGTLTATNILVSNNPQSGIANQGRLILTGSTISNSAAGLVNATGAGATLTNDTINNNSGVTGGILNAGTLTLAGTTISGNSASGPGGGILNSGTLTIAGGSITGNTSAQSGGGISNAAGASITIDDGEISGNAIGAPGGSGAGIANAGTLTLSHSTIADNTSQGGNGGIANGGSLTIDSSTISGNSAVSTAGDSAGGVQSGGALLDIHNSTIANNTSGGAGGGVNVTGGAATINSSTIAGNTAGSGAGINVGGGTLGLHNSIVFGNTGGDCGGTIASQGYNLVGTGCNLAGNGTGNIAGKDPLLDQLQNNGGKTRTIALRAGSPASDAGDDTACAAAPINGFDQRGVARPVGPRCDIGAYETTNPPAPPPSPTPKPAPEPVVVTQPEIEANDAITQANALQFDSLGRAARTGTIAVATDVDIFSFSAQPGATVAISLTNLPADYDMVLLSDPNFTAPFSSSVDLSKIADTRSGIPDTRSGIPDTRSGIPDTRSGIPDTGVENLGISEDAYDDHLISFSNQRGRSSESIDAFLQLGGHYFVLIFGHNHAASPNAYRLDVNLQDGTLVEPKIHASKDPVAELANASINTAIKTIYLYNSARMRQLYQGQGEQTAINYLLSTALKPNGTLLSDSDRKGIAIDLCEAGAGQCAATLAGNPALLPADAQLLQSLYDQWDGASRQPLLSNEVANQIRRVLDRALLTYYPGAKYLVLVGGDDVIPFYRVPDGMVSTNESDYSQQLRATRALDVNTPLDGSLFYRFVQTDNFYADNAPTPWLGRYLYLPNLGIGRLVERPSDIVHYLRGYIDSPAAAPYTVDAGAAFVTGYDFLTDEAKQVGGDLAKYIDPNGTLESTPQVHTLIGDQWQNGDLESAWFGGNLPPATGSYNGPQTLYGLTSLNGHFNHVGAAPADLKGGFFSAGRLLDPTAQLDTAAYFKIKGAPTLLYSVGCHSGLSVSEGSFPSNAALQADFPQAVMKQGGNWIGNTGFGYGSYDMVGYSERLATQLTEAIGRRINDGNGGYIGASVGESLARAKLKYVQTSGMASFSVVDEKVIEELTLYGLPFIRVKVPHPNTPLDPAPRDIPSSISTSLTSTGGVFVRTITVTNSFGPRTPNGILQVTSTIEDSFDGSTTISSQAQTRGGQPVLPMLFFDITLNPNQNAPGQGIPEPRGVRLQSATTLQNESYNPRVTSLITDQIANGYIPSEQPLRSLGAWVPSLPYTFQRLSRGGQGTFDTLLISPVQFKATSGTSGILRLFQRMVLEITYVDPRTASAANRDDTAAPTFSTIQFGTDKLTGGFRAAAAGQFTISATVGDASGTGLAEVSATYTIDGIDWRRIVLLPNGSGGYEATVAGTPAAGTGYAFFEAVDRAGNVDVAVSKGSVLLYVPLSKR